MSGGHTKGRWLVRGEQIVCDDKPIASVWTPRYVDETRLDGESWLDMRDRTQPERDAIEAEMSANAALIASAPDLQAERDKLKAANAELVALNCWRPIESAPKHTEVLVWREDSGPFIAKLTTPDGVMTTQEMERDSIEFPDDFEEWWSDGYGWQEGSERPTHWMPLPAGATT